MNSFCLTIPSRATRSALARHPIKLAFCLPSNYYGCIATIHVREVSDDTLTTLKVRAARSGQSLQAYVRQLLEGEAGMLTPEEAAERARTIAARSAVAADDVVGAIAEMREARG